MIQLVRDILEEFVERQELAAQRAESDFTADLSIVELGDRRKLRTLEFKLEAACGNCGHPLPCRLCARKAAQRERAKRSAARSTGGCSGCAKPAIPNRSMCAACAEKKKLRNAKYWSKRNDRSGQSKARD